MSRKFSQTKLDAFAKLFQHKRDEIVASIQNMDRELDGDGDEVDLIQSAVLSDLSNKLSARDLKTLERITTALEKIKNGSFGDCEECGKAIGEKRLTAIFGVETCIQCAEEQEQNSKHYRT